MTVVIVAISYNLVDFSLKYELSTSLAKSDIGSFMALFNGFSSLVAVIFSLTLLKVFIKRLGVSSILMILPLYWLLTSVGVIFHPVLATVALMAAGKYIFYYSIFSTGRELLLNVLPSSIRVLGQFFLKSIASPLAGGVLFDIFAFLW